MIRNSLLVILFAFTGLCHICCDSSESLLDDPSLKTDLKSLNFEELASSKEIEVMCNVEWEYYFLENDIDWCDVQRKGNKLLITTQQNPNKGIRNATLCLSASSLKVTVDIAQLGWGKAILLSSSLESVPVIGGNVKIEVTTNIEYKVDIEDQWVTLPTKTRSNEHPVSTNVLEFSIDANKDESIRETNISCVDSDEASEIESAVLTIRQEGLGQYTSGDPSSLKEDVLLKIISGKASSFQSGAGIESSFDGNKKTLYHSKWDNSAKDYFPIVLEYYFEENSDMDYLVYYPREDASRNGNFKEVEIEVCHNANARGVDEWETIMNYDFQGTSNARRVDFPRSLIGVSAIRLIIKSGTGDGQGFAACSEMEFYKKNPEKFDYTTLFVDQTCSELKPSVGEPEINNCSYSFFKNIAWYLYHDKYPKEFRIAEFKAYPHPDIQASENKTSPYSLLDNPTGIAVSKGEELIVFAEHIHDDNVFLCVQNLDVPGGDGFGGNKYPLTNGVNKLKMSEKGLVYVMYHTSDYEAVSPIKLHFATGTVNGYFDSQNPSHDGRQSELLANATNDYFDVLGKYAHLTFPTNSFRSHTSNLKSLIDIYDKIVYNEQALLGLDKYDRMFKNRMYFNVIYKSYMYATSYHTAYNISTLAELCNEKILSTASCWGPAHEVGHCNQTRPGVKWLGTTEVTNNIMSEYIQTTIFGQASRLQTEVMNSTVSSNRYAKAWNTVMVENRANAEAGDEFCKLVPFWQLELYFGKVLGMTPLQSEDKGGFYPDVYEYVRMNPDLPTAGEQQLEFVYIASLAAKCNLLDFFEKWGFLKPVSKEMDDYGKGTLTVTVGQADETRRRVEMLGYSNPDVPIEYITDNNYTIFKNRGSVVSGTAILQGNTLRMEGWKNVIVYEVRDGGVDGKLICVSEGVTTPSSIATFDVKDGWKDTYHVYAVAYDNRRVEVVLNK